MVAFEGMMVAFEGIEGRLLKTFRLDDNLRFCFGRWRFAGRRRHTCLGSNDISFLY
jgi:hypothetical protein